MPSLEGMEEEESWTQRWQWQLLVALSSPRLRWPFLGTKGVEDLGYLPLHVRVLTLSVDLIQTKTPTRHHL